MISEKKQDLVEKLTKSGVLEKVADLLISNMEFERGRRLTKYEASCVANKITNTQIMQMLTNAKKYIKNWKEESETDHTISKGKAWNLYAKDFNENKDYCSFDKTKLIFEFCKYLPMECRLKDKNLLSLLLVH